MKWNFTDKNFIVCIFVVDFKSLAKYSDDEKPGILIVHFG